MTPLSDHFTLEELTHSSTAQRLGIDNAPSPAIRANLMLLARGLETVRLVTGHPLHIDSGYRCQALNRAVGGAEHSAHMDGWAADFTCPEFGTPAEIVAEVIRQKVSFDKIIQEGTWVHISFDPARRGAVMTAHFGPQGTTYTEGV